MAEHEPMEGAKKVADHLGVPEATLAGWRYRNVGPPYYRLGRHVKYRMSEVEAWLEGQRTEKASA